MAAWKFDADKQPERDAESDPETAQPLFGNFRRASSLDENGEKPRSMSEMWGFSSEEERRQARRRRFWAPEAAPEHLDDEPWRQFRTEPQYAEPAAAGFEAEQPYESQDELVERWSPQEETGDYSNDLEDAGFEPEDASDSYDGPMTGSPDLHAEPVAPGASGRGGWRSFLTDAAAEAARSAVSERPRFSAFAPAASEPVHDESVSRLARRLSSASSAYPLQIEATVQLEAAVATCARLAQSWGAGFEPTVADIAIRALSRALEREPDLRELAKGIAVLDLGADQGVGCLLESPATRLFKDIVGELAAMDATLLEEIDVSVMDYGLLSIERATPRLVPGQWLAVSLGARTFGATQNGESVDWRPMANIGLAYDGQRVSDGAAARLLSRMRTLMEAPEDLIA